MILLVQNNQNQYPKKRLINLNETHAFSALFFSCFLSDLMYLGVCFIYVQSNEMQINVGHYVEILPGGLMAGAICLPVHMGEATKDDEIQASAGPAQCKRATL